MPATQISASEIIAACHEFWRVEKSFKMSKSDLKVRPIFHHTREATEADLTIVMAALAASHRLQTITGKSVTKTTETLEPIHEMNVNIAGKIQLTHGQITPATQTIPDTLGLTWPTLKWHESGFCGNTHIDTMRGIQDDFCFHPHQHIRV